MPYAVRNRKPRHVAGDPASHAQADDPPDVVAERGRGELDRVVDRLVEEVRDLHLQHEADEGQDQRGSARRPGASGGSGGPGGSTTGTGRGRWGGARRRVARRHGDGGHDRRRRPTRGHGRPGVAGCGPECGRGCSCRRLPGLVAGPHESPHTCSPSRACCSWSSSCRSAAMPRRRASTAPSASPITRRPSGVSASATRRRSTVSWQRSTRPRATKPSTTAVMLGRRTARRSANHDETAAPSLSSPSTRYWGSVRSTSARPSSTCLASHDTVRPGRPAMLPVAPIWLDYLNHMGRRSRVADGRRAAGRQAAAGGRRISSRTRRRSRP